MSPQLRDAMRGIAWEQKYRGTLEEYLEECKSDLASIEREARRLISLPPKPANLSGWPSRLIGLGTYGWKYDPEIIEKSLELKAGIIDTAEGYGFGKVEIELGKVLERVPRGETWIATKVARSHLSAKATYNAGKRSRDRLKVDSIDLYQIHWPKVSSLSETLEAMARLKEEGVIKRIGVCNFCAGQLSLAIRIARSLGLEIESDQVRMNLEDRSCEEYLLGFIKKVGLKVIAYSPIGQGSLKFKAPESLAYVTGLGAYAIPATNRVRNLALNLFLNEKAKRG